MTLNEAEQVLADPLTWDERREVVAAAMATVLVSIARSGERIAAAQERIASAYTPGPDGVSLSVWKSGGAD